MKIEPLEIIAAKALSGALKGKSLKRYLEMKYKELPDKARPALLGMVSGAARGWMVCAKALGYKYEKPKNSFRFWFDIVMAYQALYRKTEPGRLSWAFGRFPREKYLELLKLEPEDVVSDLPSGERERVLSSVPRWVWNEIAEHTNPLEFVRSLDFRDGFWIRVRDSSALAEIKKRYEVEEGPFPDVYYVRGPMRGIVRRYQPTRIVIMEMASASVAHLTKGRVLDLTSAPGGKALHAKDLGRLVIANDIDKKRFAFKGLERVVSDARTPAFRRGFDTIILDPDCSSIGRLHSPETRIWLPFINKEKLAEYQRELLRGALSLVRKGTRVIYSTCTITKEENEDHHKLFEEARMMPLKVDVGIEGRREGWRRFLPNVHKTIGFTVAVYES